MINFGRVKVVMSNSTDGTSLYVTLVEYSNTENPVLTPISIGRGTREGTATKVSGSYQTDSTQGMVQYGTYWSPLGMEGWSFKLQSTLINKPEYKIDPIDVWNSLLPGQILMVKSNKCDPYGRNDCRSPPVYAEYDLLERRSTWYVDQSVIRARKGTPHVADMELTLIRCWVLTSTTS